MRQLRDDFRKLKAAKGLKVAMVARSIRNGKPTYRISGRSDD